MLFVEVFLFGLSIDLRAPAIPVECYQYYDAQRPGSFLIFEKVVNDDDC